MTPSNELIFSTFIEIEKGREFNIDVYADGTSLWHDADFQRRCSGKQDADDFLRCIIDHDKAAAQRYFDRIGEFQVDVLMPEKVLKAVEIAARKFNNDTLTQEDEARLDRVLVPFFWKAVNPLLSEPLRTTQKELGND